MQQAPSFGCSPCVSVLRIGRTAHFNMGAVFLVWWCTFASAVVVAEVLMRVGRDSCDGDHLAVYTLRLETHWSRDVFPKQFPEWRPPAQWSRLVGRSHDESFSLFRIGESASDGLKAFCETGQTDGLEAQSQGEGGVFDEFNGPSISSGRGVSRTEFFVDGNHTKVSVAIRIVPSPDWFVGLDSLQLCNSGLWIDVLSVEAGPLDAGTDSGFTFTAPNWPTEPRQKISHITAQQPSHPANSFYYPDKQQLPPIATFHFSKDKVYRLSAESQQTPIDNHVHTVDELEAVLRQDISNDVLPSIVHDRTQRPKLSKHRRFRKGSRRAVSCQVGEWEAWSPCSVSCGVGESVRSRQVLKHPRRGGRPCPPLAETKWCGEYTACPQRFFNW